MAGGGHAQPEFATTRLLVARDKVEAQDLKSAANTKLGVIYIPKHWGQVKLLAFGFHYAAAGGAQTTDGKMELLKNGTAVGTNKVATSVANHSAGGVVEVDLNATTNNLSGPPSYPTAVYTDVLEFNVNTQGAGAGDQTVWPYLIVQIDSQRS
jgi:hypothetical protein